MFSFPSALKEIASDMSHKKDVNTLDEVKILTSLNHENIINCIDCFINENSGIFFSNCIVSEFCDVAFLKL